MIANVKFVRAAALLSVPGLLSCSVKEDRSVCPCYVSMDFENVRSVPGFENTVALVESLYGLSVQRLDLAEQEYREYEVAVPRGEVCASAVFGDDGMTLSSDTLYVDAGNAVMGSLFVWSECAECNGDSYRFEVRPHKQYCDLTLIMPGLDVPAAGNCRPLLRAGCNALSLFDLQACGSACAIPSVWMEDRKAYLLRIPRQIQGPLVLELYFDGNEGPAMVPSVAVDISGALQAGGYDWGKEDLDDAEVVLDLSSAEVSVEVVGWTGDGTIHVEI